mmetsp:Transcript_14590/g.29493  ORF Transcript_14590/g.29493 Transcript_14590/m.29493 type:complete len:210 (+) Transcript_14590:564-1193(+)
MLDPGRVVLAPVVSLAIDRFLLCFASLRRLGLPCVLLTFLLLLLLLGLRIVLVLVVRLGLRRLLLGVLDVLGELQVGILKRLDFGGERNDLLSFRRERVPLSFLFQDGVLVERLSHELLPGDVFVVVVLVLVVLDVPHKLSVTCRHVPFKQADHDVVRSVATRRETFDCDLHVLVEEGDVGIDLGHVGVERHELLLKWYIWTAFWERRS